jgi:hypothetical protein
MTPDVGKGLGALRGLATSCGIVKAVCKITNSIAVTVGIVGYATAGFDLGVMVGPIY